MRIKCVYYSESPVRTGKCEVYFLLLAGRTAPLQHPEQSSPAGGALLPACSGIRFGFFPHTESLRSAVDFLVRDHGCCPQDRCGRGFTRCDVNLEGPSSRCARWAPGELFLFVAGAQTGKLSCNAALPAVSGDGGVAAGLNDGSSVTK